MLLGVCIPLSHVDGGCVSSPSHIPSLLPLDLPSFVLCPYPIAFPTRTHAQGVFFGLWRPPSICGGPSCCDQPNIAA
jgi:hypothetical protein